MDGLLLALVLEQLNLVLFPVKDLISLERPGGLLVGLAKGGSKNDLLVLDLLDGLVLERDDPLVWFLKIDLSQNRESSTVFKINI